MKEIDARGLACPTPVLMTKTAVEDDGAKSVSILVDNEASQQNVIRFLESKGFDTEGGKSGDDFVVTGRAGDQPVIEETAGPSARRDADGQQKIMIMCATDRMGYGDDELGLKLMINFIKTLPEMGPELWRLVFVNNGVKLAVEGSELVPTLKEFENNGLTILVCGTCLTHFDLLKEKQVGVTTNMLDIVTAMQLADKVINL